MYIITNCSLCCFVIPVVSAITNKPSSLYWMKQEQARLAALYRDLLKCTSNSLIPGRKEIFYLTTHFTHFIYGYMASDMW